MMLTGGIEAADGKSIFRERVCLEIGTSVARAAPGDCHEAAGSGFMMLTDAIEVTDGRPTFRERGWLGASVPGAAPRDCHEAAYRSIKPSSFLVFRFSAI